jgi:hypothetical protein
MIDDPKEKEKCKAEVKAKYEELKEDCYETEPDCEEKAEIKFKTTLKECDAIDDPEKKKMCYVQARIAYSEDLELCNCLEEAQVWFEETMQQCKEAYFDDKEAYMKCKAKAEATYKEKVKDCYDDEPTC